VGSEGSGDEDEEDEAVALSAGLNPQALLKRALNTKFRNPFSRHSGYLVLDIGSSSVKLAEVVHESSVPRLTTLATSPLVATAIQSNVIQDEAAVVDAIKLLLDATRAQATQVITAVPGPAVIVKKVVLPAQSPHGIDSAVLSEASHLIPDSLDNVNLDYQVIDTIEDGNKMEVLVVAVKRDIINSYTGAIRGAGLEPVLVDVDYFALENMYELNYEQAGDSPVALVNVGARYSSINILKNGRSTFTGDVPVGGAEYTDTLVRQLGISPENADQVKRGRNAGGVDVTSAEPLLTGVTEFISDEIQRAISFFWTAATDEPIGSVVLSGGPARMPGLVAHLQDRLQTTVEVADPFRHVRVDGKVDRGLIEECGPALAVAVGLATRRPGDK
jgi:type IV pilus assembly protein PilM